MEAHREASASGGAAPDETRLKAAFELVDHCCAEFYFASGGGSKIEPAKFRRLYNEAEKLIDVLCGTPLARGAHRVMETLEAAIDLDPRGVLIRSGRLIRAARGEGYQTDPMALDLFVKVTQRYLAEHRELIADSECRKSPRESLEWFLSAGWPRARRLIYRLDEAFR